MTCLLDAIDGPADLGGLSDLELQQVAQDARTLIIDTIGEVGGHFGANLGTCELAVALHSVLDSPRDKILWDVGHQAYPHKILTGRRDRLATIRQYSGLAPFCARHESVHDIMGAGHASTSIGYAVGLKEGMRHRGEPDAGNVVAIIGDGGMTGGVAFEAIQQAGGLGTPIVVVLNDNGMSIAPNVGALSRLSNDAPRSPAQWWEELNWAYLGVIDGHDVHALRLALREALTSHRPALVHIETVKGKGFAPAESGGPEGMEQWHAAKPRSVVNRAPAPPAPKPPTGKSAPPDYSTVFGNQMVVEVRRDRRVIGITAAMGSGTGLKILQSAEPDHYFDVGIAEQQAVLFAAGLALEGAKPVCAIYSTFLQRAFDQIVHDVCLQKLGVVFAIDRAGLAGDDGPTHHGAFDIAYLRCLPNIVLMAPRDEAMLSRMLRTALLHSDGPTALRYPRGAAVGVPVPGRVTPLRIGTGELLREGDGRVAIIGYGSGVQKGLEAADILAARGLRATVADARFAKPLDGPMLAQLAAEHELLVTVEEGVVQAGFGSAVWESLNGQGSPPRRIVPIGLPDRYVTHGKPALLRGEVGFTGQAVAQRVEAALAASDHPTFPLASRAGAIAPATSIAEP